jgi:succinate-acetate transporter protein
MMATHTETSHPSDLAAAPAGVSIADPGPLGLAAFALTTFILSSINAGWLTGGVTTIVAGSALFYGGAVQVLAGMWEFRKGNTFGATAFASYGAFWMSFWGVLTFFKPTAGPPLQPGTVAMSASDIGHAVGVFLLAWTLFTLIMLLASLRTNGALVATFVVLTITFAVLAWGNYSGSTGLVKTGGWLGILTALLAWYASCAGLVNETWKRPALPIWKIG